VQATDQQEFSDDKKPDGKKTYRKPSIQVYGTLGQMTQAGNSVPGHAADGISPPVNNRT
jgi:hypothetical protein